MKIEEIVPKRSSVDLFNAQKARCYEFILYWKQLIRQRKTAWCEIHTPERMAREKSHSPPAYLLGSPAAFWASEKLLSTDPKFQKLYARMVEAKSKYEQSWRKVQ